MRTTSLSVLVPAYNEQHLVAASLARLEILAESPLLERVQVIVVDDGSSDGTSVALRDFAEFRGVAWREDAADEGGVRVCGAGRKGKLEWWFLRHTANRGKGHAVRTALARADGELSAIHDADLEYHPKDLARMVAVSLEEQADAVFGSRFAGAEARRALLFRHELGNRLLTLATNLVTNVNLTDIETCYKLVRTSLLRSIPLVSSDFRMEPELTIKLAKRGGRIFEVPIRYSGRTYHEGKKINWRDGWKALGAIARFGWSDKIYVEDVHGSQMLGRLARAPRFHAWMADTLRPHCGARVLEIGSGMGNLSRLLIPRDCYVASDVNPLYVEALRGLAMDRPYMRIARTDVADGESFPSIRGGFDTVLCVNVIEHIEDDVGALQNVRAALAPQGRAVVLVPQGPELFGTLDEVLGHKRRYTKRGLRKLAYDAGFEVLELSEFNRSGRPAWWLNSKLLRRRSFDLLQIAALNALAPLFRRIDSVLPFPGLSLIAVLRPASADSPQRQRVPSAAGVRVER